MSSLVPEGWVSTTIDEATSEISDGGTPATSNAEYFNGSIPWVVIDDIQPRIVHTKSSITELGLQKSSAKLWDKGTIILSTGATIGEVGIAMKAMATKQGICGVVVKSGVSAKYFYHLLVSKKRQLNILSQGSTIKETRPPTVKKIQICLPPLPEQKKIASILTSVDEVIENTQKQIDKLQDLKKATMNDLLTKGIGHTEFKDSELGQIPKSWKICSLGELGQIVDPHPSHRAPPEVNDGIPFLGIGDLKENGDVDTSKVRLVGREEILEHEKRYQISENTIGFGRVASIGKIIDFPMELKDVLISPTLAVIEPHSVQKKFLVNYLKSQLITNQLNFLITGSTRSSLGIQLLRELSILLPPPPEQKEVASVLTAMDKTIEQKKTKLVQTQSLKKSLMQDLLTGKVRV